MHTTAAACAATVVYIQSITSRSGAARSLNSVGAGLFTHVCHCTTVCDCIPLLYTHHACLQYKPYNLQCTQLVHPNHSNIGSVMPSSKSGLGTQSSYTPLQPLHNNVPLTHEHVQHEDIPAHVRLSRRQTKHTSCYMPCISTGTARQQSRSVTFARWLGQQPACSKNTLQQSILRQPN